MANAGADRVASPGSMVTLDGSKSFDPAGNPLTYQWTLGSPSGSAATLSGASTVNPTFTVDVPGTYTATLVVNDGTMSSEPATVTVSTSYAKPVANAGYDQTAMVGSTVTLDGTRSIDYDGNSLSYQWAFVSVPTGSSATLAGADTPNPTFVPDVNGDYKIALVVGDGTQQSDPSTVSVSTQNSKPVANAGPGETVWVGQNVPLSGAGSFDPDGRTLSFQWSFVSIPNGSAATLQNPTAVNPAFTADVPGNYVVQLIVSDGVLASDPATATITTGASAPVANAGADQSAAVQSTVTLDGSKSSDSNGNPLTFKWSLLYEPTGSTATLSSASTVNPTFVVDLPGTYVAQLVVNDGNRDSAPATVKVVTQNVKPVANAGLGQTARVGDYVILYKISTGVEKAAHHADAGICGLESVVARKTVGLAITAVAGQDLAGDPARARFGILE